MRRLNYEHLMYVQFRLGYVKFKLGYNIKSISFY